MKRLVVGVVVLVALLLVLDVLARLWVERRIEDRTEAHLHGVGAVDAGVSSFPFLGRLAVAGEVSHVTLRLDDVTGAGIDLSQIRLSVDGMVFDRGSLVSGDRVEVESVDRVTVRITITDRALSEATRVSIALDDDQARVTAAGRTVTARVRVVDGRIRFAVEPLPVVSVALPTADVLPCEPTVEIEPRQLVLVCEADELPPRVIEAIGEVVATETPGG